MAPPNAFRLRWKGAVTGPFPLARVQELLRAGEISLLHNIEVDDAVAQIDLGIQSCAVRVGEVSPRGGVGEIVVFIRVREGRDDEREQESNTTFDELTEH